MISKGNFNTGYKGGKKTTLVNKNLFPATSTSLSSGEEVASTRINFFAFIEIHFLLPIPIGFHKVGNKVNAFFYWLNKILQNYECIQLH